MRNREGDNIDAKGNIVLFQPSVRVGVARQNRTGVPLGLLAIATPLDIAGYRVKIIDQFVDRNWKDMLREELAKKTICVGISVKTGPQIRFALEASKIVKENGNVPVVWGGIHPSLLPEQTLQNENIDIVVQGEGEETFSELVRALEHNEPLGNVRGIWYKENGTIGKTPPRSFIDLNAQPSLSYHLIDIKKFLVRNLGIDHMRISSSRGCPYRCGFCYNTVFYKNTWRALSAQKTFAIIQKFRNTYGIRGIRFADDLFFGSIERVKEILQKIVDSNLDIAITKLDIHVNELSQLDDDFFCLLKKAGGRVLVVGVESGSQRILDVINKGIKIPDVLAFNRRVKKFGIIPRYCFMMGFPTETMEDIRATVDLIFKLLEENEDTIKDINIYTPYPGTALYDLSMKHGLKPPEKLEDWVSFNWRTINRKKTPWITGEREKLLRMLHCSSQFLEKNYFLNPLWPTNPLVVFLARLYHPFAKLRVKKLFWRFPIEIKLAEWLHLYPRQV
ncbi:B12-binding domain-containing radical SAM protein [Candidatus Latescibacterota bacterium]